MNGKQHGYSVPKGLLEPKVAEARRDFAQQVLPPVLADLVCSTKDIFVQAIHDYLAPDFIFEDKIALIGDSGCILRPHTGAGTTKAAINAWALATCLQDSGFDVEAALKRYNAVTMEIAKDLVQVGVKIGTESQVPERINNSGGGGGGST